jgi:DNA-binding transcriptional LysR family regulator
MNAMVMQSDCLTFIPRELIYWEVQSGQLQPLHVSGTDWTRMVGITRRRRGVLSAASLKLIEALREIARRQFSGSTG